MRCKVCGAENREGIRFCTQCGNRIEKPIETEVKILPEKTEEKKKTGHKWLYICAVIATAVLCAAGGYIYKVKQDKHKYDQFMQDAQKCIEKEDYDSAKNFYYLAINNYPEKIESYIELINVCIIQNNFEEANKILGQVEGLYEEKTQIAKGEKDSVEKQIEKFKKTIKDKIKDNSESVVEKVPYRWYMEPVIEADNIDYATYANYYEKSLNELNSQYSSPYAIIQKGNSLGLIDMDGNLKADMQYESIVNYAGDYCLVKKGAKDAEDTYVIPPSGDDELIPIGDWGYGYVVHNWYYYDNELHEVYENDDIFQEEEIPYTGLPVRQSSGILDVDGNWNEQLDGSGYAIWHNDELVTDFIYDECGSSSCGLLAVCKDGKWGYIDDFGEIVIPIEYDASWKYYYDPLMQCNINFEYTGKIFPDKMGEYCYAAAEGYIPLCKDGIWELRNASGELVIPAGEFEEIRPPYGGKCWVKQDGKWGVIELQGEGLAESSEDISADIGQSMTYQEVYTPILQEIDERYSSEEGMRDYYLYDIDKNGIKELIVGTGEYIGEAKYEIYTVKNGESLKLGSIEGSWASFYEDETGGTENYIIEVQANAGFEDISHIWIEGENVYQEYVSSMELSEDEEYYSNDYPLSWAEYPNLTLLEEGGGI